jgi:hypothetical protein
MHVAGETSGRLAGQATTPGPLSPGISQPLNGLQAGSEKVCTNCKVTWTPLWRKQKGTKQDLCNACGIEHTTKGRHRDPNAPAKRGGVRKISSAKVCCQCWPQMCVVAQLGFHVCHSRATLPSVFSPQSMVRCTVMAGVCCERCFAMK